ncbi:MAG: hypothetical protein M1819_006117 [Sarea resinae]|nr:MAG: hypothetical protein M1819_006117 [Sarea resinae]
MKKFLHKAKASLQDSSSQFPSAGHSSSSGHSSNPKFTKEEDSPSSIRPPSPDDLLRYRYHHGTNLGSVFVLEKWLSGSMFVKGANGGSELDAVNASLKANGLDGTRAKWEKHWNDAISDSDFDWLVNTAHCTTIRLPIGYFTLGPNFTSGTPFAGQPAQVYVNAWSAVKNLTARARAHGIGILLDLHALPGGANKDSHSGTSNKQAGLWSSKSHLSLSQHCLVYMAQEAKAMDGVVGIQLLNEAGWNAPGMYQWYDSVIAAISQVDPTMPLYISDAWNLAPALEYSNKKNSLNNGLGSNPVVVDTHKYYTFSDADKSQSPQQIIGKIPGALDAQNGKEGNVVDHGAGQVIVGEYSCTLDGQTWSKVSDGERPGLTVQFGRAQSQLWQQRTGGSYFWTYKMDWMPGGDWGFVANTNNKAIPPPPGLLLSKQDISSRLSSAHSRREDQKTGALTNHSNYWDSTAKGKQFQHNRFADGFDVGFSDAMAFFEGKDSIAGGNKIGMLDLWLRKRVLESGQGGEFVWEWEQGFRQGVGAFYSAAGV